MRSVWMSPCPPAGGGGSRSVTPRAGPRGSPGSGQDSRYMDMAGGPMPENQRRRKIEGGALAGVGGTAAGVGLLGGGIPGLKADSEVTHNMKRVDKETGAKNSWAKRTGASLASGRGGIFGWRTQAHQGFLEDKVADKAKNTGDTTRVNMYHRGVDTGKIGP